MGRQYLIDSNAVIDYLAGKLSHEGMSFMNDVINDIPNISVITKIEILGYPVSNQAIQLLRSFVDDSIVFGLSDQIVEQTIQIRKKHRTKTPDAIIAASALVNKFALISRNVRDFKDIEGIEVINPHEL